MMWIFMKESAQHLSSIYEVLIYSITLGKDTKVLERSSTSGTSDTWSKGCRTKEYCALVSLPKGILNPVSLIIYLLYLLILNFSWLKQA